jgi:hypothetical protein
MVALALAGATSAHAISIDAGNSDIEMRWDNSVRYNAGWRMEDPNSHFAKTAGHDETEARFKQGDLVTNRLDLLTEFDFVYRGSYGFRVSAAAWSEFAYDDKSKTNPALTAAYGPLAPKSNYGASRKYASYAESYATGSSGEFLDVFAFGNFNLGDTSLKLKLGQHNVYWGEALYTIADGVSAGLGPIDTIKAATSPGAEAKELFMPINQLSAQWQLSDTLSANALYQFDWKPFRLVPGGTYFGPSDGAGDPYGSDPTCASVSVGGGCIRSLDSVTPGRNGGDYGLALRWSPAWLDGTMGFYYRKYDEKLPWSSTQQAGGLAGLSNPANLGVRLSYARGTEMYGMSLSKAVYGVSVGVEASYRKNTALNTVSGFFVGSGGANTTGVTQVAPGVFVPTFFLTPAGRAIPLNQTPTYEQVEGARGNTWHGVLNAIYLLPKTPLWDGGTLQGELAYQKLDKVTENANLFYSEDYLCKKGYMPSGIAAGKRSKNDGCSTDDALALNVGFTPEWPQAFPSWDLSMPTSFSYGLMGNGVTLGGSVQGGYKYSIGLKAKYQARYEFTLAYNDASTDYNTQVGSAANGSVPGAEVVSTMAGSAASANNRGWLSFSFKTSF